MSKTSVQPPSATGVDKDMQAHSDLHTLISAAKIHADKPRHKAAMAKHAEMMQAMQQVAQQAQQPPQGAMPPQGGPAPAGPAGPSANGGAF